MRNIYELEVIDYQIEAKFFGLDKLESDVRITIQGTQSIVQLASVYDKPGFIKLSDLTKFSITEPSIGKLSHIKVRSCQTNLKTKTFNKTFKLSKFV